jgi:aerobic carbon-monoxide dehydrogenase small subunit
VGVRSEVGSGVDLTLQVDGAEHRIPPGLAGESLLRVLRDELGITSVKNACEQGECGSCTVQMGDTIVNACLVAAAQARGLSITTAASGAGDDLDPVQAALLAAGGVQCGFCTPGIVVAARDLLSRCPQPSDADIREALAGNLCRCTGYEKIREAIRAAAGP